MENSIIADENAVGHWLFGCGGAAVGFWPYIAEFFTETVIPWLRNEVGTDVAEQVANFIIWLDKGISPVRSTVRKWYRAFQENVLGVKTEFTKVSATEVTSTTETYVHMKDGQAVKLTVSGKVAWEDLPESVRSEMMRQNKRKASLDMKDAILEKAKERAQEEGMTLEV